MKRKRKNALKGFLFVLPFLTGFFLFFIIPFFWSIQLSFTKGAGGTIFAGMENYVSVFQSMAFRLSAYNTFRFMLIGVPLLMAFAFFISLVLYRKFYGASLFRSVFLYPLVVPIAALVLVVNAFFSKDGIMNQLYSFLGIPVRDWLNSEAAFGILIFLYIWKYCGYNIVLFLAGLNSIPEDFFQAAQLEGARSSQMVRRIIMPLLVPNFFFVFVISVVNSFKCFREAYLIGGSDPHKSIYMLQHFMNNNFQNLNYQRLSVAAIFVFLVISLLVLLLFLLKNRQERIEM